MSGMELEETEWKRVFRLKRGIERMMEQHTLADVMARERSPYITGQATEGNRHQRRAQARKNRRGIGDPNDDALADDAARYEAVLAEHGVVIGEK